MGSDLMQDLKINWYIGLFSPVFRSDPCIMSPPAIYSNQYPDIQIIGFPLATGTLAI